ncbi:S-adenosyl-L-methionine-dependent methyltransferase [Xylaria grammica]|nr:S-adenosyl-L-methionine-dependent methyltransferase [Xylaria grammica]
MNVEECGGRETQKTRKRPPRKKRNPIETAISFWYEIYADRLKNQYDVGHLVAQAPKRWTAYGPLVLLPAGSFTSPAWRIALDLAANSALGTAGDGKHTSEDLRGPMLLWKTILDEISGSPTVKLTHLAINEGIPPHSKESNEGVEATAEIGESENILRSPSGLRMLYGDFGPSTLLMPTRHARESALRPEKVTEEDFLRAFWVSTKQNGITQTWAPRWTMFSRGNIKEKARLLDFHDSENSPSSPSRKDGDLSHRQIPAKQRAGALAVDLYAGIGYFAFCYATLGFRVLCWELNAWSVEGLRRGAQANGWSVRVVRPPSSSSDETEQEEEEMLEEVLAGRETIVVFLEDNARAAGRIRRLDELTREREARGKRNSADDGEKRDIGLRKSDVVHVNCGLLPTSRGSWATAWDVAAEAPRAWFHIHENVGVPDIEAKKDEIREWFAERARTLGGAGGRTDVCAEHVELVKTFAPGVWHCVFDLYVRRSTDTAGSIT